MKNSLKICALVSALVLTGCGVEDAPDAGQGCVTVDGLFEVCGVSAVRVDDGEGAPDLHVRGDASRLIASDAVLCAWAGTSAFPYLGFACDGDLPVEMREGESYAFGFDSGYSAEQFDQDPADVGYRFCPVSPSADTCYAQ